MSVNWSEFLPNVRLEAPMAPHGILIAAVRDAAVTFCKESQAWREKLEPTIIAVDSKEIEVEHPDGARVHRIINARYGSIDLNMPDSLALDATDPGWLDDDAETGTPHSIILLSDDSIRLVKHPSYEDELKLRAVLKPSKTSEAGPDFLYLSHCELIEKGAKAKLLELTKVPWSDPGRALQLNEQFILGARSEGINAVRGFTRAPIRTTCEYR